MKTWIEQNCLRKDGKITAHCGRKEWWESRCFDTWLNRLFEETKCTHPESSIADRIRSILTDNTSSVFCKVCNLQIPQFQKYCTSACAQKDPVLTIRAKAKAKQTLHEKYGVENAFQLPNSRIAISNTQKNRKRSTGFDHHTRQKFSHDQLEYLKDPAKLVEFIATNKLPITVASTTLGFSPSYLHKFMSEVGVIYDSFAGSGIQRKFAAEFSSVKHSQNVRGMLGKKEIDIYFPDHSVGIEVNGLFWHSVNRVGAMYHLEKQVLAENAGIRLLQFFDCELNRKLSICKSIVESALGNTTRIGARKCELAKISSPEYKRILEENHIQGYCPSSVRYGLYLDGKLVAAMGFSKSRFSNDVEWELTRYVSVTGTTIVGGASRMFKRFLSDEKPNSVISFSDRRLFSGALYPTLGFTKFGSTKPNYWYWNDSVSGELMNRLRFQKHKLQKVLKSSFDPEISEQKNMESAGYNRVYDCGNVKWIWTK